MALLEAPLASLVGGPQGTVFLGEAQGRVGRGIRGDFRKRSETFEMAPLDAPIASLVAGPRATVLQGEAQGFVGQGIRGGPYRRVHYRAPGRLPSSLRGHVF